MAQHVNHLGTTFNGLDVPGKGDQITPIAVVLKHRRSAVYVARRKRFAKV
jgi:hypothetical protein